MAYIKNVSAGQNNVVVISGSQVQVTGSLYGSVLSGTTGQFTTISGTNEQISNDSFINGRAIISSNNVTASGGFPKLFVRQNTFTDTYGIRVENGGGNNAYLNLGLGANSSVIASDQSIYIKNDTATNHILLNSGRYIYLNSGQGGTFAGVQMYNSATLVALTDQANSFVVSGTVGSSTEGRLRFANLGTAAAPLITQLNDTNTGIYFPNADTVAISTNGTERLRITGSGDVILGNISGTTAQFTTITGSTIVSTTQLPSFIAINTSSNNTHRLLINQSSQANNGLRVTGQGSIIDLYGSIGNIATMEIVGGYSIGHQVTTATNGIITAGRTLNFRTYDNGSISGFNFQVSSSGAGFNNTVAQITRTGDIYAAGNVTGSTISGTTAQFTSITGSHTGSGDGLYNLTASGISNFTNDVRAQFSAGTNITIVGGVISAAGGTGSGNPGGPDTSVQFNKAGNFSGSSNLIYNYTTNILSGTTAQFTTVTASNVVIYGTASLFSNPQAAYLVYSSGSDKLVAYPGLIISGSLTGSAAQFTTVSGTTAQFTLITGSTITGSTALFTTITGSTITGSNALFNNITTNTLTGSSINITGTISGSSTQSIIKSDQGISFRTRDNGTGSFVERLFISTNDVVNFYSSINGAAITASVLTANVITSSVLITGSTAQFTLISGSTVTGSTAQFTVISASIITATSSSIIDTSSSLAALRITQRGNGESIRVEDETNPDTTAFIVDSVGNVIIGKQTANSKFDLLGDAIISGNLIVTGSISGATAQFLSITGTLFGTASNADLLDGLDSSAFAIPSLSNTFTATQSFQNYISGTTADFNTITVNTLNAKNIGPFTGSSVLITGDVVINGTASVSVLNTLNQNTLTITDKYIVIASGGLDHASLDGSGILWGTASLIDPTVDEQGSSAHIRFVSSSDQLRIYPGLFVSGNLTGSGHISASNAYFTYITASVISASSYLGITAGSTTPGGIDTTIQFNKSNSFSGSSNLIYNYTTNILSGTTAQFTIVTGTRAYVSDKMSISTTSFDVTNPEKLLISGSNINLIVAKTNIDNYSQLNITNKNAGVNASSDIVATNDTGTESSYYIDMGINSSGFSGALGLANEAYLYNTGSNLWIGNATPGPNGNIKFFAGNLGTSVAMFISSSGKVGIGTTNPSGALEVSGDARFLNNLVVLGTASVGQLNTVNQTSLVIGDKYLTILSGAVDHASLDGSGILWGSGTVDVTQDDLGANAHVRFDGARDKIRIFPGLYVSGGTGVDFKDNLTVSGTTKLLNNISGTTAQFTTLSASNILINGTPIGTSPGGGLSDAEVMARILWRI